MTRTATLTFDLTDPDSLRAYRLANKAEDMANVLHEFDEYLRNQTRYLEKDEQHDIATVRDTLHITMSAHGIKVPE
jgi:hypothetical protein